MSVKIKKLEKGDVELTIEVSKELQDKAYKATLKEMCKEVELPGFRKGKVPEKKILEKYSEEYIRMQSQPDACNQAYLEAVQKERIDVIDAPRDFEFTSEDPLTFKVKVAVMPEIKIDDSYKKISVKKNDTKVTDKEIKDTLDELKNQLKTFEEDKEHKAKKGDKVIMDFQGYDLEKNEPLEGTQGKEFTVIIGENSLIPGFEDELVGLKAGDHKDFEIEFPKDYHQESFKGKKVKFHVDVLSIEKVIIPELDEEMIEKIRGKKMSQDEFKKDIEKRLLDEKEQRERARREDEFLDEAVKKFIKEPLPAPFIKEEQEYMMQEMKQRIASQGLDPKQYFEHMKKSEEEMKEEWKDEAAKRAAKRFVLTRMLQKEEVKVSDEDIEAEVAEIAKQYESDEHKKKLTEIYKKPEARMNLSKRLEITKFFDSVLK